jgi:hypothetical protein
MRAPGRRRGALLVVIIAASSSIATSPPPQLVATQSIKYDDTFELSAAAPVAVRRLSVLFTAEDEPTGLGASLAARIEAPGLKDGGVRLTILPDQPGNPEMVELIKQGETEPETAFFAYDRGYPERSSCPQLPCARTYRVVVELVDDEATDTTKVSFLARGDLTVTGLEKVPEGISLKIDPIDDVLLLDRPPEVLGTSEVQDAEIGGPDRRGSEVHAVVTFTSDALPAQPVWPVVPELILHVEAAEDAAPTVAAGQLSLFVDHPDGNTPNGQQFVVFSPEQLPFSVSLQPIPGCPAGLPCSIPVDATLGAQSPGDVVPVRWWIEARVRYFEGAVMPAGAAVQLSTQTAAEYAGQSLKLCANEGILVLFEAKNRGLVTDEEFKAQLDKYDAGTWDPTFVEKLEQYDELCLAALESIRTSEATPSPPASELDPFAPRAEATLAEETRVLTIKTPVVVRDIRLVRNAAATDPAAAGAIGYLHIDTSAPTSANPRAYINAFIRIVRVESGEAIVERFDIPSSHLAGPPLEVDPWIGCQALAPCTVDLRVILAFWDWEPVVEHEVSWTVKAGMAWPGRPAAPQGAEVGIETLRSFEVRADADALQDEAAGTDVVLARDGEVVTRHVTFELSGDSWPAELANVPMPGHGLFRVTATGTGTGPAPVVGTLIQPAQQVADRGLGGAATVNADALIQAFFPFNVCKGHAPCVSDYSFEFTRVGKGGDYGPISVEWSLEAMLRTFKSIEFPRGAELTIRIAD